MTREWSFTLTVVSKWYNLWSDLIAKDSTFTDPTFTNAPFVPARINELVIQNQTTATILSRSDSKLETGFTISGGSIDRRAGEKNNIDLKNINLSTNTNPTVVYVSIVAN